MLLPKIEALGTHWHIELFEDCTDETALRNAIIDWLEEYESRYSRFRSDSWLSVLNRDGEFLNPDPQFVDLLNLSLDYYQKTDGVFNIAVGEKLLQAGYDDAYSFSASEQETIVPKLPDILSITDSRITLSTGKLDLGGIGKGYAIDALADYLKNEHSLSYFLINGGGDMYATSDNDQPIHIVLGHPYDKTLGIGSVALKDAGFAASSQHVRSWVDAKNNTAQNHLLTTKKTATYLTSVSTTEADVWATALCLDQSLHTPSNVQALVLDEINIKRCDRAFMLYSKAGV